MNHFFKKILLLGVLTISSYATSFNLSSIGGNSPLEDSSQTVDSNKKEAIIYKDMLAYLKNSNDANQLMVLGSLLATGTDIKDSLGEIIKSDPIQAEMYMIKSAELGNIRAYSILGGLFLMNENMRNFDKDLSLAEKYLSLGFEKGDLEAGVLLANLYIEKNESKKGLTLLFDLSNKNDSNAQLGLALLFKNGLFDLEGNHVLEKNINSANYYLNLACTNPVKSDKIKNFCFGSKTVEVTKTK